MRTPVERQLAFQNFLKAVEFVPGNGEAKVLLERLLDEVARSHAEADLLSGTYVRQWREV
jgi:hypothetical protein